MPSKPHKPHKRRISATGRSVGGDGQHVRLYRWELDSPAYRSLCVGARALLVEVRALCNGTNNGELFLSVREAASRLGCDKDFAAKLFAELRDRGFIRPREVGAFNLKVASGKGKATSWILANEPFGNAVAGTKDYMRWQPAPKKISRSPDKGHPVPSQGTVPFKPRSTVPSQGTLSTIAGQKRSLAGGHS